MLLGYYGNGDSKREMVMVMLMCDVVCGGVHIGLVNGVGKGNEVSFLLF